MGSGLSSDHRGRSSSSFHQPPSARVIGADGSLREFPASCVSVSDVLGRGNAGRFFLCSSDALYFDGDVPPLGTDELLRPGQIYFVLPGAMLGRPLPAADMAALAVRASEALASPRRGLGTDKARVVPALAASGYDGEVNEKLNQRTLTLGGLETAASPIPTSNRLAVAARTMKKRALTSIQEVAE